MTPIVKITPSDLALGCPSCRRLLAVLAAALFAALTLSVVSAQTVTVAAAAETIEETVGPPVVDFRMNPEYGNEKNPLPTRVHLILDIHPHASTTKFTAEYATSKNGPWTVAYSATHQPGSQNGDVILIKHLLPATPYYVRGKGENASGSAEATFQFTTPAIEAPKFFELGSVEFMQGTNIVGEAGATVANLAFEPYAAGAETSWSAEYSESKEAVEHEAGTLVPGASGTITAFAEGELFTGALSSLTPETTYYLRVKASNVAGTTAPIVSFVTHAYPEQAVWSNGGVSRITATSAHLVGEVIAHEQETHWRVEYATPTEAETGNWTTGATGTIPALPGDNGFQTVEADLNALEPDTVYYVRLFAENTYGHTTSSEYVGFQTLGAPVVTTFPTHAIHGESLRPLGSLSASPVPGDTTHYHFEYVTKHDFDESEFSDASNTPEVGVSGGIKNEESIEAAGHTVKLSFPVTEIVGEDLPQLEPGESYVYRLVAANDEGAGQGAAQTLAQPAVAPPGSAEACPNEALRTGPSAALPDCRGYEQITPPNKQGSSDLYTWGAGGDQYNALIGEDGEHVLLYSPFEDLGSNSDVFDGGYVFSRVGEGDWHTTSVTPQPETGFDSYALGQGGLFNADLTEIGFVASWGTIGAHSPEEIFKTGVPGGPYATAASVPSSLEPAHNLWAGASADFHTLVLSTDDHALMGSPTGTETATENGAGATGIGEDLYEYVEGKLRQLNVDSSGKTIGACGARLVQGNQGEVEHAGIHSLSADGSRVFFVASPTSTCPGNWGLGEKLGSDPGRHLYMHVDGSSTVDIGEYTFLGANGDGSKLLLAKDHAGTGEVFLYDTETLTAKHLLSVPADQDLAPERAHVSEDLSTIYILAPESLGAGAPAAAPFRPGIETDAGTSDLYRYDVASETLRFAFQINEQSSHRSTRIDGPFMSPDGRYYYWKSSYGNPGVPHPEKHRNERGEIVSNGIEDAYRFEQLYRYDSTENVVQCVSCASPYDPEPLMEAVAEANQGENNSVDGVPQFRIASDDGGHVFFETPAALVPQDINGEVAFQGIAGGSPSFDVYEWRKPGVDGCSRIQGCIGLISGGREGLRNKFLGTTPSGRDVFFATHEALVAQDTDTAGDIYDAREDGGEAPPAQRPVQCEGDACAAPFTAPSEITPSSSTFQGAGNMLVAPVSGGTVKHAVKKPKKKRVIKRKRRGRKSSFAKRSAHAYRGGGK